MAVAVAADGLINVGNVKLEITERGSGKPLVFLHAGHPAGRPDPAAPIWAKFAQSHRLIAPTHPGFGHEAAPENLTTVDDLAYFYLDLMDARDLHDVVLVGVGLGGWIAAEIAVKSTQRLSHLVLADAVGIKPGNREARDIADIYAIVDKELAALAYADPALGMPDKSKLSDDEFFFMACSREATGRYAWSPYMHNPKLLGRLHRIRIPTLVLWGEADGIVTPEYGRHFAAAIAGARFETISKAGHLPYIEQPEIFADRVLAFVEGKVPEAAS
ncbi:MAG: alpha/beta fold hydrolase [Proteobacteria bacterium]|nr:alpha/beta fold hydrolase [Pseudomonadota bacterium]